MPSQYPFTSQWWELYEADMVDVTHDDIIEGYLDWVKVNEYTFLRNRDTGDVIYILNSKRGNDTYARKKKAIFDDIGELLNTNSFSEPAYPEWGRKNTKYAYTMALFITFTFGTKDFSRIEAWKSVTRTVNRWVAFFRKSMGINCSRFLLSESNENGYPAPHAILLLDKPVLCFHHRSKKTGKYTWRIQDQDVVNDLHDAWRRSTDGSYVVDIQGIVDGSITGNIAISDYLSKSCKVSSYLKKSASATNDISIMTHAYQKFLKKKDYVSTEFWERLGRDNTQTLSRLDYTINVLKPLKKVIRKISLVLARYDDLPYPFCRADPLYRRLSSAFDYYMARIEDIKNSIPPPQWEYYDRFTVRNFKDMQTMIDLILVHTKKTA